MPGSAETELHGALFEHSADGVLLTTPAGRILRANPAACRLLGRTEPELQRLGRSELVEDEPGIRALLEERERQGLARGEVVFRRADGSRLLAEVTSVIVPGRDQVFAYVIFRDLSERKRTEAALRSTNRALLSLSRCNEALVRAASEQALYEEVCRIVVEVGGYRMSWVGLVEHDERRTVRPVAWAGHDQGYLASADVVWSDTERGRGPVGTAVRTRRPVSSRDVLTDPVMAPWRAEALQRGFRSLAALPLVHDGDCIGVLTMYASDVEVFGEEELRLLEQLADDLAFGVAARRDRAERDALNAQLAQTDRLVAMGTLAAGVAHEINNPLAYVVSALQHLEETLRAAPPEGLAAAATGEALGVLAEAREGAERVRLIAGDLRTFSRVEDPRVERVELPPVIDSALHLAANELRHRARVVKDYGPVPAVNANAAKLGQVFLNLLVNAAQAIPAGQADRHQVRITTSTDADGRARVEIRDTGVGVPAEVAGRIFEPFFTTKAPAEGTGLGLSICRNLITALGGEIGYQSVPGQGSSFQVTLPAAGPAVQAPAPPPAAAPAAAGRRGRVAVVDDEAGVRRAIARALSSAHEVTAFDGAQALAGRVAAGDRFDAILCDLMMPDVTGMMLYEQLKASAPDQAAAMIFMTGGAFTVEAREFLDAVPNARLEKPYDVAALRALVRRQVA